MRGRLLATRVIVREGRVDRGARIRQGGTGFGARQRNVSTAAVVVSVAVFRADAFPGDVEFVVVDEGGFVGTRVGAVGAAVVGVVTVAGDDVNESVAHDEIDVVTVRDGVRGGADEVRARLSGEAGSPSASIWLALRAWWSWGDARGGRARGAQEPSGAAVTS